MKILNFVSNKVVNLDKIENRNGYGYILLQNLVVHTRKYVLQ